MGSEYRGKILNPYKILHDDRLSFYGLLKYFLFLQLVRYIKYRFRIIIFEIIHGMNCNTSPLHARIYIGWRFPDTQFVELSKSLKNDSPLTP
jgi:hypothetical protein